MSLTLVQKLKQYEKQIVFLHWGSTAEYGKIKYVGMDFVEFEVLDTDTMEYTETVLINHQIILEMVVGGYDISIIIAEYSSKLSMEQK